MQFYVNVDAACMKMSGFDALFVQAVSTDPMGMLCSVSDWD